MRCPICGSSSSHDLTKDECRYYRCQDCDFLFHRPGNGGEEKPISLSYDEAYWAREREEALRREKEDCFIRVLELLYLSTIRVENTLDFGCGLGVSVQLLRDRLGLNAVGVDLSADFAKRGYLHRCGLETLQTIYPPGYFDAIYSIEVFEHLQDPKSTLSMLRTMLNPEGIIFINTSTQEHIAQYDPEMNYIDPGRRGHISIYSLKSFAKLASSIGYTARFLSNHRFSVVLTPENLAGSFPHPDNTERLRKLGDWFPGFWREHMRLVFLEGEFEEKAAWADALNAEVNHLRDVHNALLGDYKSPAMRAARLLRDLWRWRPGDPTLGTRIRSAIRKSLSSKTRAGR